LTTALAVTVAVTSSKTNKRKREVQNLNIEIKKYKLLVGELLVHADELPEKSLALAASNTLLLNIDYAEAVLAHETLSEKDTKWGAEQRNKLTKFNSDIDSLAIDLEKKSDKNVELMMTDMSDEDYKQINSRIESLIISLAAIDMGTEYGEFRADMRENIDTLKQYRASPSDPEQKEILDKNISKATQVHEMTLEQYIEQKKTVEERLAETRSNVEKAETASKQYAQKEVIRDKMDEQNRSRKQIESFMNSNKAIIGRPGPTREVKYLFRAYTAASEKFSQAMTAGNVEEAVAYQEYAQHLLDSMQGQIQTITSEQETREIDPKAIQQEAATKAVEQEVNRPEARPEARARPL